MLANFLCQECKTEVWKQTEFCRLDNQNIMYYKASAPEYFHYKFHIKYEKQSSSNVSINDRKEIVINSGRKTINISATQMLKVTSRLTCTLVFSAHVHLDLTLENWQDCMEKSVSLLFRTNSVICVTCWLCLFANSRKNICTKPQSLASKSFTTFAAYSPTEIVILYWIILIIMSWGYKLQVLKNNKEQIACM